MLADGFADAELEAFEVQGLGVRDRVLLDHLFQVLLVDVLDVRKHVLFQDLVHVLANIIVVTVLTRAQLVHMLAQELDVDPVLLSI